LETGCGFLLQLFIREFVRWRRPISARQCLPSNCRARSSKRYRSRFADPAFQPLERELKAIIGAAWDGYSNSRKESKN
jgi:hypothetical protein